jgi:hypothetical protein
MTHDQSAVDVSSSLLESTFPQVGESATAEQLAAAVALAEDISGSQLASLAIMAMALPLRQPEWRNIAQRITLAYPDFGQQKPRFEASRIAAVAVSSILTNSEDSAASLTSGSPEDTLAVAILAAGSFSRGEKVGLGGLRSLAFDRLNARTARSRVRKQNGSADPILPTSGQLEQAWTNPASAAELISDSLSSIATSMKGQSSPKSSSLHDLQEEVNAMWWYLAQFSESEGSKYEDLPICQRAFAAGWDLACLSSRPAGVLGGPALLSRFFSNVPAEKVELRRCLEEIGALQVKSSPALTAGIEAIESNMPLFPLLWPLSHGYGESWQKEWEEGTTLHANTSWSPLEIGAQAYYEGLLVNALTQN